MIFQSPFSLVNAHDLTDISEAERELLWDEFRFYLLNNPEILQEMVATLQKNEETIKSNFQREAIIENADALYNDPNSWQGGNLNGDITIVEFIDYRCGFCRRAHADVAELLATDSGVRLIVKEFPILTEDSRKSAQIALAALRNGGSTAYKKAHDFLIEFDGAITEATIATIAEITNVDLDILKKDVESDEIQEILNSNKKLASALLIDSTPTFIIENNLIAGYLEIDALRQIVKALRDN